MKLITTIQLNLGNLVDIRLENGLNNENTGLINDDHILMMITY